MNRLHRLGFFLVLVLCSIGFSYITLLTLVSIDNELVSLTELLGSASTYVAAFLVISLIVSTIGLHILVVTYVIVELYERICLAKKLRQQTNSVFSCSPYSRRIAARRRHYQSRRVRQW